MSYVKLVPSLLTSTVWAEDPPTKLTWITLLLLSDRDGLVPARAPGIARAAGLTVDQVRAALAIFVAPDPDSRTRDFDGRRIEETDDGILILNYEKYRDVASAEERAEKARARAKRAYDRKKKLLGVNPDCEDATCGVCTACKNTAEELAGEKK